MDRGENAGAFFTFVFAWPGSAAGFYYWFLNQWADSMRSIYNLSRILNSLYIIKYEFKDGFCPEKSQISRLLDNFDPVRVVPLQSEANASPMW
jgi:hypothetical protein